MAKKTQIRRPAKAAALTSEIRDRNNMRLLQARSSVVSAIMALECRGTMFGELAVMLRMSALRPLDEIVR